MKRPASALRVVARQKHHTAASPRIVLTTVIVFGVTPSAMAARVT